MFLLHTHHRITFYLFCCQGDAKTSAPSKQLHNQEDKLTQPIGEFESQMAVLVGGGAPLSVQRVRPERITTDTKKGN